MKNEFYLQGKVLRFDEHPMKRELLVETFGAFQPITDECPIYVPVTCNMPPDRELEHGDNILIYGHIVSIKPRKTRFIRLIATEISRDDAKREG